MSNEYGLDYKYFTHKLALIVSDAENYTTEEMARELARLSYAANSHECVNEVMRLTTENLGATSAEEAIEKGDFDNDVKKALLLLNKAANGG